MSLSLTPAGSAFGLSAKVAPSNVNAPGFVERYLDKLASLNILAPKGVKQIGAFAFDYKETEEVELDAEIPDHWLEDNSAVQDHIGLRPATVTLTGYVSELFLPASTLFSILGALSSVTNTLTQANAYVGNYGAGNIQKMLKALTQAQNAVVQIEQAAARSAQVASFFSAGPKKTRQQQAYAQLKALRDARIVFTVYTPYQVFDNMAIESLRAVRPKDTKTWSSFSVRLKQLNFSNDVTTARYLSQLAGRRASQGQVGTNGGPTAGTPIGSIGGLKIAPVP